MNKRKSYLSHLIHDHECPLYTVKEEREKA